jgi:hypothetical protein
MALPEWLQPVTGKLCSQGPPQRCEGYEILLGGGREKAGSPLSDVMYFSYCVCYVITARWLARYFGGT